ncbi:siderophore-interacting protein [Leucobacter chinensis]|uniref:siderophore-interacting protein n=1 Tax=Leucobacter chinensis TaxID=2851010 RepID=UPI001C2371C4|nr:siderophore-interacting protein [Leucobacter chinensis]
MQFTRERVMHELKRRTLRVTNVTQVAPDYARITVTSPELEGFEAPGPADHIKLIFGEAHGRPIMRDYTPLNFRETAEGYELDIDMVLHETDGPASDWAKEAAPGQLIQQAGPRGSKLAPAGITEMVLVADETAFPAVTRWLDAVSDDVTVHKFFFTVDERMRAYFDDQDDITWFDIDEAPEGIMAELRKLNITDTTFAFLAGEATTITPLRRYLRREAGIRLDQLDAQGYWKRGVAELDHHEPLDPEDPDE